MTPTDSIFHGALINLLTEILTGPPSEAAYILNPGDPGLVNQLDTIDAATASARPMPGKTTIAAHVDHVAYGLSLLNRWSSGEENPWASADWSASWKRGQVTEAQWRTLRDNLRREAEAWQKHAAVRKEWDEIAASGAISSVAHTAYHLGAIRQLIAASAK